MADIKFEIKETAGVLSESEKGWKKELNIDELKALKEILNGMDI